MIFGMKQITAEEVPKKKIASFGQMISLILKTTKQ